MHSTWHLLIFYCSQAEIAPAKVSLANHFSVVADDFLTMQHRRGKKLQLTSPLIYSIYGMKRNKTSCIFHFSPFPHLLFRELLLTCIVSLNKFTAHPCKQLSWQKMGTVLWDVFSPFLFCCGVATCSFTAL